MVLGTGEGSCISCPLGMEFFLRNTKLFPHLFKMLHQRQNAKNGLLYSIEIVLVYERFKVKPSAS